MMIHRNSVAATIKERSEFKAAQMKMYGFSSEEFDKIMELIDIFPGTYYDLILAITSVHPFDPKEYSSLKERLNISVSS